MFVEQPQDFLLKWTASTKVLTRTDETACSFEWRKRVGRGREIVVSFYAEKVNSSRIYQQIHISSSSSSNRNTFACLLSVCHCQAHGKNCVWAQQLKINSHNLIVSPFLSFSSLLSCNLSAITVTTRQFLSPRFNFLNSTLWHVGSALPHNPATCCYWRAEFKPSAFVRLSGHDSK